MPLCVRLLHPIAFLRNRSKNIIGKWMNTLKEKLYIILCRLISYLRGHKARRARNFKSPLRKVFLEKVWFSACPACLCALVCKITSYETANFFHLSFYSYLYKILFHSFSHIDLSFWARLEVRHHVVRALFLCDFSI